MLIKCTESHSKLRMPASTASCPAPCCGPLGTRRALDHHQLPDHAWWAHVWPEVEGRPLGLPRGPRLCAGPSLERPLQAQGSRRPPKDHHQGQLWPRGLARERSSTLTEATEAALPSAHIALTLSPRASLGPWPPRHEGSALVRLVLSVEPESGLPGRGQSPKLADHGLQAHKPMVLRAAVPRTGLSHSRPLLLPYLALPQGQVAGGQCGVCTFNRKTAQGSAVQ